MTFSPTHPRDFWNDYAAPAYELWRQKQSSKHLAIHAITQVDIVAEVTAIWLKEKGAISKRGAGKYRERLAIQYPVIGRMAELHNAHKHGKLNWGTTEFVDGVRPEMIQRLGFFLGVTHLNSRRTRYQSLGVRKAAGGDEKIATLLFDARKAWDEIFAVHGW